MTTDEPSTAEKRRRPLYVEVLARIVIGFAVLGLLTHFVARPYVIPSGSMEPTLLQGDRGFARVAGLDPGDLDRGDVVAFAHGPTWESERIDEPNPVKDVIRYGGDLLGVGPSHYAYTLKRVLGLPGETVSCCDDSGRLLVDGEPQDEPYVTKDQPFTDTLTCAEPAESGLRSMRCFPEVIVPEDSYLVLGDHRANSSDSVVACRGLAADATCAARFVRADQVVGIVSWRWWPFPPGDALREP